MSEPTDDLAALVAAEYEGWVRAVAVFTGDADSAEDAVQDAVAKAWRRTVDGRPLVAASGWIVVVATNGVRQRWRRRQRDRAAGERLGHGSTPSYDDLDALVDVDAAVRALPFRQRQVVVLYYLLGLDVAATAAALGVSDGTVKSGLARARRALAPRLAVIDPEEERA